MINASFDCGAARRGAAVEALAMAVILCGLTQSGEARGDPAAKVVEDMPPLVGGRPISLAFVPQYAVSEPAFSSSEFRPRRPSLLEAPRAAEPESMSQTAAMQSASPWQRLTDYRSQGRVQLLTLWESNHNSVSLQAGKHGGPSLQWSGRLQNRGATTRGLLDRFIASSLSAAGLGSKAGARSSTASSKSGNSPQAVKSP